MKKYTIKCEATSFTYTREIWANSEKEAKAEARKDLKQTLRHPNLKIVDEK